MVLADLGPGGQSMGKLQQILNTPHTRFQGTQPGLSHESETLELKLTNSRMLKVIRKSIILSILCLKLHTHTDVI